MILIVFSYIKKIWVQIYVLQKPFIYIISLLEYPTYSHAIFRVRHRLYGFVDTFFKKSVRSVFPVAVLGFVEMNLLSVSMKETTFHRHIWCMSTRIDTILETHL
jgi:hypothetical protein